MAKLNKFIKETNEKVIVKLKNKKSRYEDKMNEQ